MMDLSKVLVAVPTRGQVSWGTCTRLQALRDANPGLGPVKYVPGHLSVAATRNKIVRLFLEGEWEALLMVDDDVIPASCVLNMVHELGVWDVIAQPTFIWRPEIAPVPITATFGLTSLVAPGVAVREAQTVGTGCIAIHRRVLEGLPAEPFCIGFEDGQDVSDDVMFCRAVHTAGFRIGADFTSAADHHTTVSLQSIVMSAQAHVSQAQA
jgi:hypothetical protein